MGPRRPTGSAVLVTPARSPRAPAETTTPERRSRQSPVPPRCAVRWEPCPRSALLPSVLYGARLPFPARSTAARSPRATQGLQAPAGRPRSRAGFGRRWRPCARRCVGSYSGARRGPAGVAVAMATRKRSARAMAGTGLRNERSTNPSNGQNRRLGAATARMRQTG